MKIHFIGIGGIGVSSLARFYLAKGFKITGSDLTASEITQNLEYDGVQVFIDHKKKNVTKDINRVICSAAIKVNNPELQEAGRLKIPTLSYAEALGELTKQYITIAISGSHGKSTTTALLSLMLVNAGLDPTVIIGTRLRELGGNNFRFGRSRYLVIEADEWAKSFHNYFPTIAIVTNIDKEHLDTYKNLTGVIGGFNRYLRNLAPKGMAVINAKDENSLKAIKRCKAQITYFNKRVFAKWPLKIPGRFNQLNAEAAWRAASFLGISRRVAEAAVKNYEGSWRRMEFILPKNNFLPGTFINDYAHHPTEIKAVISGVRQLFPKKKFILVFQPHQIERLANLFKEFVDCFNGADLAAILPAYKVAGREYRGGKSSDDLVIAINKKYQNGACLLKNFDESLSLIREKGGKDAVIAFVGAGDIDREVRRYFNSKLF